MSSDSPHLAGTPHTTQHASTVWAIGFLGSNKDTKHTGERLQLDHTACKKRHCANTNSPPQQIHSQHGIRRGTQNYQLTNTALNPEKQNAKTPTLFFQRSLQHTPTNLASTTALHNCTHPSPAASRTAIMKLRAHSNQLNESC